jgi:hypothetical protein
MVFQDKSHLLMLVELVALAAAVQVADQQAELEEQVYYTCTIKIC